METNNKKLSDSKAFRFTALIIVSVTMMFGYFFTDVMAPLESLLTAEKGSEGGLGMGWTSSEYGWFSGAYGLMNVYLLLLFFGGIILDKFGIRFTGVMSTTLMFVGALIKWWAVSTDFGDATIWVPFGGDVQAQVAYAGLGFAIYGVGCEIAGITVSKVIVKWFTGHELALAMGLQVALARVGTAVTMAVSLPLAKAMGGVSAPVALGAACLCIGLIAFLVYNVMDKKEDAAAAAAATGPEDGFKFSDLTLLFGNKGFWYITLLCLMFDVFTNIITFCKCQRVIFINVCKDSTDYDTIISFISVGIHSGLCSKTKVFKNLYGRLIILHTALLSSKVTNL